jgi:hypothetical protein
MKTCQQCGPQNEDGADFCGNCGAFVEWRKTSAAPPQQAPAETPDPATLGVASVPLTDEKVTIPSSEETQPAAEQHPAASRVSTRRVAMTLSLASADVPVEPGGQGFCQLQVRNSGTIVDRLGLQVATQGMSWASVEPSLLNIFPGEVATATAKSEATARLPAARWSERTIPLREDRSPPLLRLPLSSNRTSPPSLQSGARGLRDRDTFDAEHSPRRNWQQAPLCAISEARRRSPGGGEWAGTSSPATRPPMQRALELSPTIKLAEGGDPARVPKTALFPLVPLR